MRNKSFSDQVSVRRESRAKSLGHMRSFAPTEARRFLAPNTPHLLLTDDALSALDADDCTKGNHASNFFYKSTIAVPSASLRRSRSEAPSADSDIFGSFRPTQNVSAASSSATGTSGTASIPNHNESFILLLHQEAMYRQLFFPEVDHWFTSLVEAAWDERDRLILSSEETVQRYWLLSDETKGRETIFHFLENAELRMWRSSQAKELCTAELVQRSTITQEFLASAAELQSTILADQVLSLSSSKHSLKTASPLTPKPPSRGGEQQAQTPRRDSQVVKQSTPQTERHTVVAGSEEAYPNSEVMTKFVFGSFPQLLQFVVDAEESVRSRIESRWYVERSAWSALHRGYRDRSSLLRLPNGSKSLVLEDAESAERRMITSCFFDMLCEACSKLETLERRHLMFHCDPLAREEIETQEREGWLYARRAECAASDARSFAEHEVMKAEKLANFKLHQFLSGQREMFFRAECDERFELQRREARMFSLLMESAMDSRLLAAPAQHLFSKRNETMIWNPQTYNDVYLAEIRGRGAVCALEKEHFSRIQSSEASAFVHTRRNMLINDDVEAQLREFDRRMDEARRHLEEP